MSKSSKNSSTSMLVRHLGLAMLPALLMLAMGLWGVLGWVLPMLERDFLKQKELQIHHLVETQLSALEFAYGNVQTGHWSEGDAQSWALQNLSQMRYGDDSAGYFWVIGPNGRLWSHGILPKLVGQSPDTLFASTGVFMGVLLDSMQRIAKRASHGGFYRYPWPKTADSLSSVIEKEAYVRHFAPWNWVLATGVDLSEVKVEFAQIRFRVLGGGLLLLGLLVVYSLFLVFRMLSMQNRFLYYEAESLRLAESQKEMGLQVERETKKLLNLNEVLRERQLELQGLEKQLNIAGRIFESSSDGVMITDGAASIIRVNPSFCAITGYTFEEVVGQNPRILQSSRHGKEFYQKMWDDLAQKGSYSGEIWNRRKNGEAFPCYLEITAVKNTQGELTEYISILRDLTDLQRSRDQLAHLNDHDPLTGLPNRQSFVGSLYAACMHARQSQGHLAVAILGVDRLSRINKTAGYVVGDQVLQEVGRRLRAALPPTFLLGRFAGDEFACAIPFRQKSWDALQLLERLKAALVEPFDLEGKEISVTACVGVAFYPEDTGEPEALTRLASISLDRAKQEKPNTLRPFTDDLHQALGHRISLENDLRRGIDRNEFTMYFQPKIQMATGACHSAESLIRWFRSDGSMVPPDQFISVAEEIGEIDRLGMIALRQSCRMARQLNQAGTPMRIAVNVSPKQLFTSGFTLQVLRMLEVEQVDPRWLELEITESAVMEDLDQATRIMGDLVVEGLQFTLDDFGTGYSSLSHIRTLPIGGFKIDRSFVLDLAENKETQAICSLFVKLAKDLHLELTVEGVETAEQIAFIQRFPEAYVQGYYYSRPLAPADFRSFLSFPKAP